MRKTARTGIPLLEFWKRASPKIQAHELVLSTCHAWAMCGCSHLDSLAGSKASLLPPSKPGTLFFKVTEHYNQGL